MAQTTRDEWRQAKKDHGIPDAVCKFSLGEKLAKYAKAYAAAGLNSAVLEDPTEDLLADLKKYAIALGKLPVSTFKGKTDAEKKRNANDAREFVDEMIKWQESYLEGLQAVSKPLEAMHKAFKKALTQYRTLLLGHGDKDVYKFYTEEMRMIGTPLKLALRLPLPAPTIQLMTDYKALMDEVNDHVQAKEAEEALEKMYAALRTISPVFAG